MSILNARIAKGIKLETMDTVHISHNCIIKSIKKLNAGKSDGNLGFDSDHIIHACNRLHIMISMLFNMMLCHGHTPSDLLAATIISIPKDAKASLCRDDNYRGIALCSALCKLLDLVIIDMYKPELETSYLQFGFKECHSTVMCTSVYTETINYYVNKNSNVYSCLLDASKAFDRVHYGKLFNILIDRNVPCTIVRLLLDSYIRQELCINWDNYKSQYFTVSNGVKQGGVLSPILFTLYIDDLLIQLQKSNLGCNFNGIYAGVLGYADDLTLLSPSLHALNRMIHICENYAKEYDIAFNAKKTMCIKYGENVNQFDTALLNGAPIEWFNQVRHLGNIVCSDLSDRADCDKKCSVFIGYFNKLTANFSNLPRVVLSKLFKSFCCSFYGSQLWNFNSSGFQKCCIAWNKAVRRLLNLPMKTHTWMLGPVMDQLHIKEQLYVKSLKFVYTMMN